MRSQQPSRSSPNPNKSPKKTLKYLYVTYTAFVHIITSLAKETSSPTPCLSEPMLFQDLGSRKIVADFQGGNVSSDGGLLLLRQVDSGLSAIETR
jgi:hypothetical protein